MSSTISVATRGRIGKASRTSRTSNRAARTTSRITRTQGRTPGTTQGKTLKDRTRELGEFFGRRLPTRAVPRVSFQKHLDLDVTIKLVDGRTRRPVPRKTGARRYRAALKGTDELFSTASVLDFLEGVLSTPGFTNAHVQRVRPWIDLLSNIRIATEHSGFATVGEIMQHPANRQKAGFADPWKTARVHAELDTARREYILRAMEREVRHRSDSGEVLLAGARAAIEFTLNHFTAPITAWNVHPFTRRAGTPVGHPDLIAQVDNRELMKTVYEQLGGTLRPPILGENATTAITRTWRLGLPKASPQDPYPEAPPSPRRR